MRCFPTALAALLLSTANAEDFPASTDPQSEPVHPCISGSHNCERESTFCYSPYGSEWGNGQNRQYTCVCKPGYKRSADDDIKQCTRKTHDGYSSSWKYWHYKPTAATTGHPCNSGNHSCNGNSTFCYAPFGQDPSHPLHQEFLCGCRPGFARVGNELDSCSRSVEESGGLSDVTMLLLACMRDRVPVSEKVFASM